MAAFAWLDKISSIMNDDFKLGLVPFLDSSMSSTVAILISLLGRDFTVAYDKFNEILVLMKKWKTETPKSSLGRRSEGEGEPDSRPRKGTLMPPCEHLKTALTW